MVALTTGGYKLGETTLTAYSFEHRPLTEACFRCGSASSARHGSSRDGTLNLVDPWFVVSKPASNTAFAKLIRLGSMPPMKWAF